MALHLLPAAISGTARMVYGYRPNLPWIYLFSNKRNKKAFEL
ncbi:MAG: hypothetical protein U5J96_07165 [Ignavibacteriaceae bacterium]|nr:hypothetical protein [Ignavibacteriaceae bacterium]